MRVANKKLSEIKPYDKNPRHNDAAVDAVAASISEFGFRQPIVVDEDMTIIAGHTRYKAATKLGIDKVPVHVATGLSLEQIKAFRIADNKTSESATWDLDLLPIELQSLVDADFDIELTGFSESELNEMMQTETKNGLTDPDEVPDVPDDPITQPGDLWLLGPYFECEECGKRYEYDEGIAIGECPCG